MTGPVSEHMTFASLAKAEPVTLPSDQVEGGLIQAADVLLTWLRGLGAQVVDIGYDVIEGKAEMVATWPGGRTIELGLTAAGG